MPVDTLQHFTVEPSDLERSKQFYCSVLGLEVGFRPALGYPGYWLYSGDSAIVHLLGERNAISGVQSRPKDAKYDGTGRFDHIAFAARDFGGMKERILHQKVLYREVIDENAGLVQLLFKDPDGIDIELNFPIPDTGAQ